MTKTKGELAFEAALELVHRFGLAPFVAGPQTAEAVTALERRLNVGLPPSYKAMLRQFGTISFGGVEVYGLARFGGLDAQSIPNVVFATESEQAAGCITPSMVHVMASGYGPIYVLDCSEPDGFGEVPIYEIALGGVAHGRDRLAPSFGEFILGEVERLVREDYAEAEPLR